MQRLIARILLLTALLGSSVPVALAIGAPAPHACCIRRWHNTPTTIGFQAVHPVRGNCCPPRTPSLWAAPVAIGDFEYEFVVTTSEAEPPTQHPYVTVITRKSVRAPPSLSIA